MKCGRCRQSGHNRTTCSNTERLPQAPPDELMRLLIDPWQALALIMEGKAGEALANATRRIGEMDRDGLGHLACSDILIALAELELRGRQLPPVMLEDIHSTHDAIAAAERALEEARRAQAEVLVVLGYRAKAEALGLKAGSGAEAVHEGAL